MFRLRLALLVAAMALACYQDDASGPAQSNIGPRTRVLITDAPFPFDTVQSVDVYIVSIAVSTEPDTGDSADNMTWLTVAEPHRQINLLDLQRGITALLGEQELRADQYRAVRVIIDGDSSALRFTDGSPALVHWGGIGRQALHVFVEAAVDVPEEGADIVIDFDVGRSFHYNDLGDGGFNFFPFVRAVNKAATGSVAGTVERDASGGGTPGPVAHATVSAWVGSAGNRQIISTGTTDATGHYRLAYLLPGTYVVGVDPPSLSPLAARLDSNVVVTRAVETQHLITLSAFPGSLSINGASSMVVGATKPLEAIVLNGQRQQEPDAPVEWQNLDAAILGLVVDSVRFARVSAKAVGSGRIVATSGSLTDTLVINVAADSTP